jgi:glycosyltransferase involved in cell wall biosynthesis
MEPQIGVVIATHNRRALLAEAVRGALSQTLPRHEYEVIVVDNRSTDDTRDWVQHEMTSVANLRYVREPELGASAARNAGWRSTSAPYVALLDDDAIPGPDWLECILRIFREVHPHPVCLGGAVEPIFEIAPPEWLTGSLLDYLTVVEHSPHPKFLTDIIRTQKLASANMAFERTVLEKIGGFSSRLDRVGDNLLSGGDVLPQLQMEKLGLPVYYDPAVRVRHHVSARRLTPEWLVERAYWGGVSDALLSFYIRGGSLWWALRTLSWGVRSAARSPRLMFSLTRTSNESVAAKCDASHRLGSLVGGWWAIRRVVTGC